MNTHLEHALTKLARGRLLSIDGGRGRAVAVFRGVVWITQHNEQRDVILGEGESFTLDRPRLAIVQALRDAGVLLIERIDRPGESADLASPRISAYELHIRARQWRAQAVADAASRLVSLPGLLWTRLVKPSLERTSRARVAAHFEH